MLGILGGMGPLATADFLGKLITNTRVTVDQEHVPVVVYSVPQVPDRNDAILHNGEDPLPALLNGVRVLENAGALCIAIACNAAHHWHPELVRRSSIPILHIADAAMAAIKAAGIEGGKIGLLASTAVVVTGIYGERLQSAGYECVVPQDQERVMRAIRLIKAGQMAPAKSMLESAATELLDRGCLRLVLGCTEVPLAFPAEHHLSGALIDANTELARACVHWYQSFAAEGKHGSAPAQARMIHDADMAAVSERGAL